MDEKWVCWIGWRMVSSQKRKFLVKSKDRDGVDDEGLSKKINSQPLHLGSFMKIPFEKINEWCYFDIRRSNKN